MTVSSAVCVRVPSGGLLSTSACGCCGKQSQASPVRIPRTYPFGLLFGIAFALPPLLALSIAAIWGTRDLFDIMAGTGGRNAIELQVLRALPVAVPVLLSIAAVSGRFCVERKRDPD